MGCVSQQEQALRRGAAQLGRHEWWLTDLARELGMPRVTLFGWIKRGWVTAHQLTDRRRSWIIHADPAEVERLRRLHQQSRGHQPLQAWLDHQQAAIIRNKKGSPDDDVEPHV
ncbi:hypothetical protein [Streptomyces mirabilis]|uniref:hypothetical protein n=1 Tax=Streptomyces mirabilis TaxID=68239 RepID=UPI0036DBCE7A